MALVENTAPASEPITLAEAKAQARVDIDDENSLIDNLYIPAARQSIEIFLRRSLINTTWDLYLDGFPGVIDVPRPPLSSVTSITYTDTAGDSQTLTEGTDFAVDLYTEPGRIVAYYGTTWPSTQMVPNAVKVTFVAGYGATASSVPVIYKTALAMLVAHWVRNREPMLIGTIAKELPMHVQSLLWNKRVYQPS